MTPSKNILRIIVGTSLLAIFPTYVSAHGWSEFPKARQAICHDQGGLWSGSPPNAACANAKEISGQYQFVQRHEYSKNVIDYRNTNEVKRLIPNGTLCYANDKLKSGIGEPHPAWTRTEINAGTFEYVFHATVAHNPSFWEFYLTKPNADLSKRLAWNDLELIQTEGNITADGDKKYRINVTIPSDRYGDAILFVRWQRIDDGGEGFYNCSDITIKNGGATTPTNEHAPSPDLSRIASFIPDGFQAPEIGDTVKYDILDKDGKIIRSFDVAVGAANINAWDRLLAAKINGWHDTYQKGSIFIGDWHDEMQHYMFFQNDSSLNFFNAKDNQTSGRMTVSRSNNDSSPSLTGQLYELSKSDNVVNAGDKMVIVMDEAAMLTQTQGTPVRMENNGSSSIIINTDSITQNETLIFSATNPQSNRDEIFTFEVISSEATLQQTVSSGDAWNSSKTYLGGEVVTYANQSWQAQWWVQGGEDPKSTYNGNIWGAWRPAN